MRLTLLVLSVILLTSFNPQGKINYWYTNEVKILETCSGNEVELLILMGTDSRRRVFVHSFELENVDFTIFNDTVEIAASSLIRLNRKAPVKLRVKYKLPSSEKPAKFTFKTYDAGSIVNEVRINYGQYVITYEDIVEGKEQFIPVSKSCQDSIQVFFPHAGSQSGATIYSDSGTTKKEVKSLGYGIWDEGNYLTFKKADTGRYYVVFLSSNIGNAFWLNVE